MGLTVKQRIADKLNRMGLLRWMPDKLFLQFMFPIKMGYKLDLDAPKTYSQKLQWLKLYDHKDIYTAMVDKYEAKKYVADRIGEEYIIPTLGVWDSFEEIDFDVLPEQFVLKCTHDSGSVVICRDKTKFDREQAKEKLTKSLHADFYSLTREWPYKHVKPRIIAENYMEDSQVSQLIDYKFFCFDGEAKAFVIVMDKHVEGKETKADYYDGQFNHLPFTNGYPNAPVTPAKPAAYEEMKKLAVILSQDLPQARIDFYEVNGKIYFGEITFFHWSGWMPFDPFEWDLKFGEWIRLPDRKQQDMK